MNNKSTMIKSPTDGIIPTSISIIMILSASIVMGMITHSDLGVSILFGLIIWVAIFYTWIKIFLIIASNKINSEKLIRYEVVIRLNEERNNGYTDNLFTLSLGPERVHRLIVHLANGGGITHSALGNLGFTRNEITAIQEKFLDQGLIECKNKGSSNNQGYTLTSRGKHIVKIWSRYPSPSEDKAGAFWQKA